MIIFISHPYYRTEMIQYHTGIIYPTSDIKRPKKACVLRAGYYIMAVIILITQSRSIRVKHHNRLITDGFVFSKLEREKLSLLKCFMEMKRLR